MKKLSLYIFLVLMFLSKSSIAKNIPHPMEFNGSDKEKKNVIAFIESNIHEIYCENELLKDMCTNTLLRVMEEEELNAFKKLIKAKDKTILNKIIQTYCKNPLIEGMCMYSLILTMYEEGVKASGQKLTW